MYAVAAAYINIVLYYKAKRYFVNIQYTYIAYVKYWHCIDISRKRAIYSRFAMFLVCFPVFKLVYREDEYSGSRGHQRKNVNN